MGEESTIYWLSADWTIAQVSASWDAIAVANEGPKAIAEQVVGRPLREFVHGDTSWMWVETVLSVVHHLGRPKVRPYRCDTPTHRRFMTMTVEPWDTGLQVTHRTDRTEPLAQPVDVRFANGAGAADLLRCSVCNRVQVNAHWIEPDVYAQTFDLSTLHVQHVVCDDCLQAPLGSPGEDSTR